MRTDEEPLTPREMDVLRRVAEGRRNAEIARDLFLGEQTVRTYVARILAELGAATRAHAVAIGFRRNLLS